MIQVHRGNRQQVALVASLKACAKHKDLHKGSRIHADILKRGLFDNNIYIGNTIVNLYAKCGAFGKAQEILDELRVRDVVSWNTLIGGYAQHGHCEEALNCFDRMQQEGLCPDAVTFLCILKACGSVGAVDTGKQIHAEITRKGLLAKDTLLGTALVDMYARCGDLEKAQEVFDELKVRNVVSWTSLIAGYVRHRHGEEALFCFRQMQREGLSPNAVTLVCILKACSIIGSADKGEEIHREIARKGLLGKNRFLETALMDMYAKCGQLEKAQEVFEELPVWDVVSWNALITGYTHHGHGEKALRCFEQMQREGFTPNTITLVCILKACGNVGAADKGKEIHTEIVKGGLLVKDTLLVGTALVDMYAKCGELGKAQEVFEELQDQSVPCWTALIAGYTEHGHGEEALICFERMQHKGLSPNAITFLCVLKACGSVGATEKGKEVHAEVVRCGLLEKDISVGRALVDMYAKCGAFEKAQLVFDELPVRDVVSWTALIAGYAQAGKDEIVFNSFNKMIGEGIEPNLVTFTVVLNACSNSGALEKGQICFKALNTCYGIIPRLEHYTCMADLFGRAGHFDNALAVIKKMPTSHYLPVWKALLGACRQWGYVRLGRVAFDYAVQLDEKDAAVYICMSNMYVAAGMHEDANKIEAMREKNKAWNVVGGLI